MHLPVLVRVHPTWGGGGGGACGAVVRVAGEAGGRGAVVTETAGEGATGAGTGGAVVTTIVGDGLGVSLAEGLSAVGLAVTAGTGFSCSDGAGADDWAKAGPSQNRAATAARLQLAIFAGRLVCVADQQPSAIGSRNSHQRTRTQNFHDDCLVCTFARARSMGATSTSRLLPGFVAGCREGICQAGGRDRDEGPYIDSWAATFRPRPMGAAILRLVDAVTAGPPARPGRPHPGLRRRRGGPPAGA